MSEQMLRLAVMVCALVVFLLTVVLSFAASVAPAVEQHVWRLFG